MSSAVVDVFSAALEARPEDAETYARLPWRGSLRGDTAQVAANIAGVKGASLRAAYCRAIQKEEDPFVAQDLAEAVLFLLQDADAPAANAETFTAIAESDAAWKYNTDLTTILRRFGIEHDRNSLRQTLGLPPIPPPPGEPENAVSLLASDYGGPPIPLVASRFVPPESVPPTPGVRGVRET